MFGPMKNIGIRAGGRTGSLSTLISILYKLYSAARFFKLLPIDGKPNECQTRQYNEEANVFTITSEGLQSSLSRRRNNLQFYHNKREIE